MEVNSPTRENGNTREITRTAKSPLEGNLPKKHRSDREGITEISFLGTSHLPLDHASFTELVEAVSDAVTVKTATSVTESLKDEISMLKKELLIKEKVIQTLENKCAAFEARLADLDSRVDTGEKYSRCESVRITGIPENTNKDVENTIMKLGKAIGADILPDMIDRAHRVGPFKPTNATPRMIICKFTGHKQKI